MQRLAQMQGSSIDMLSLNASASALEQPLPPIQTLPLMCQRMGLSKPKLVKQPDRVHLPLVGRLRRQQQRRGVGAAAQGHGNGKSGGRLPQDRRKGVLQGRRQISGRPWCP